MRLFSSLLTALIATALPLMLINEVRAESPEQVQAALDELHDWLGEESNGTAWRQWLQSEALQAQIEKGENADPQVLQEILALYAGDTFGLHRRQFGTVQTALEAWYVILSLIKRDELPDAIEAAKSAFIPVEDRSQQAKQRLIDALRDLELSLNLSGEEREAGWKKFLRWDDLQETLENEGGPDLKVLNRVGSRLHQTHPGLQLPLFVDARLALTDYIDASIFSGESVTQQYEAQLDGLTATLEAYNETPSHENAAAVAYRAGWLQRTGQAEAVVAAVRHHYAQPNLLFYASEALVVAGIEGNLDETKPVEYSSNGIPVRGTSHTSGRIEARLVPNSEVAQVEARLEGTSTSNTRALPGPVTIHTTSVTQFEVTKQLFFDKDGARAQQAEANGSTDVTIDNVTGSGRAVSIASERVQNSLPATEARASRRVERQVSRQMDERTDESLSKLNETYNDQYLNPLSLRDHFPSYFRTHSTDAFIFAKLVQASTFQLGATSDPPPLDEGHDFAVRMHASMLNNYVESVLAGRKWKDEEVADYVQGLIGRIPQALQVGPDDDPWSITFATNRPLTVEFSDQVCRLKIRGRRFTSESRRIRAMDISVAYDASMGSAGGKLVRRGDIEIIPANFYTRAHKKLTPKETAETTVLKRRFDKLFPPERESDGLELPGRWKSAGKLKLQQLSMENGWLVAGWKMP